MPSSQPSLKIEAATKLTMLEMRGVKVTLEKYKRLGWTVFITMDDGGFMTHFDAKTADECVLDAFDYCMGVWGDTS